LARPLVRAEAAAEREERVGLIAKPRTEEPEVMVLRVRTLTSV
jgi:hypothetical protein